MLRGVNLLDTAKIQFLSPNYAPEKTPFLPLIFHASHLNGKSIFPPSTLIAEQIVSKEADYKEIDLQNRENNNNTELKRAHFMLH